MNTPFRWDLNRREQLGSWLGQVQDVPSLNRNGLAELRTTAAQVVAAAEGADLGFVGRTPENYFDYLAGVFQNLAPAPGLHLVQYSMRWPPSGGVDAIPSHDFAALTRYFRDEGIHPGDIVAARNRLALVDFVATGGTFETLCRALARMAREAGIDWASVQRKLVLIGLRARTKNSPNTWRWQQHQDWLDLIPDSVIHNVSVDPAFIFHLANDQTKTTPAFTQQRWSSAPGRQFTPDADNLVALSRAVQLFDHGATAAERRGLAGAIAAQPQMTHPRVRTLVTALKSG